MILNYKNAFIKKQKSFSIVEISTVLLIIGLLSSGTLVTKALVTRARIVKTIGKLNDYKNAVLIFKSLYNQFPGNLDEGTCIAFDIFAKQSISFFGLKMPFCTANYSGQIGLTQYSCMNCPIIAGAKNFAADAAASAFLNASSIIINNKNINLTGLDSTTESYNVLKMIFEEYEKNVFLSISPRANLFGNRLEFTVNKNSQLYIDFFEKNHVTLFGATQNLNTSVGALTSEMASKIDLKIDDGNPLTG